MNRIQRAVLVVGALALLLVGATAPQVQYGNDGLVFGRDRVGRLANVTDVRTALVRGAAVVGATVLVWFAASSSRRPRPPE